MLVPGSGREKEGTSMIDAVSLLYPKPSKGTAKKELLYTDLQCSGMPLLHTSVHSTNVSGVESPGTRLSYILLPSQQLCVL